MKNSQLKLNDLDWTFHCPHNIHKYSVTSAYLQMKLTENINHICISAPGEMKKNPDPLKFICRPRTKRVI